KSGFKKKLLKSAIRIFALAGFILFIGYASLIATSDPAALEQKQVVDRAIDVLEKQGFGSEVFILRHLVFYRVTDNWWNKKVGHDSAYASTNFPFEIVTLYPPFFDQPVDDVERATILLHEAYHLSGRSEPAACEGTWRDKQKLGWTKEKYQSTVVWINVKDATMQYAPQLFQCGPDHKSDCIE